MGYIFQFILCVKDDEMSSEILTTSVQMIKAYYAYHSSMNDKIRVTKTFVVNNHAQSATMNIIVHNQSTYRSDPHHNKVASYSICD